MDFYNINAGRRIFSNGKLTISQLVKLLAKKKKTIAIAKQKLLTHKTTEIQQNIL